MPSGRFVAVYRWRVAADGIDAFERWWREGTDELRAAGSFGSTLIREPDGAYVGIAIWPDDATRARAFAARADAAPAPGVVAFEEIATGTEWDNRWVY